MKYLITLCVLFCFDPSLLHVQNSVQKRRSAVSASFSLNELCFDTWTVSSGPWVTSWMQWTIYLLQESQPIHFLLLMSFFICGPLLRVLFMDWHGDLFKKTHQDPQKLPRFGHHPILMFCCIFWHIQNYEKIMMRSMYKPWQKGIPLCITSRPGWDTRLLKNLWQFLTKKKWL